MAYKNFYNIALVLLLTACSLNTENTTEIDQTKINLDGKTYHEIETELTIEDDGAINLADLVISEVNRLKSAGEIFWHDENNLEERTNMYRLERKKECEGDSKNNCTITGLTAYKYNLPPDITINSCDDNRCQIAEPKLSEEFLAQTTNKTEFYLFGKDIYTIMLTNEGYSIFKNEDKIFTGNMFGLGNELIEEANVVVNLPAFTFHQDKSKRNIWYNNETINEKFSMDGSSYLFEYKDKIGFVGEKDDKKFLFFNGQKISQDFDKIRTKGCCAIFPYPITLDSNGILFFLAKRDGKYFFVEVNLNQYID